MSVLPRQDVKTAAAKARRALRDGCRSALAMREFGNLARALDFATRHFAMGKDFERLFLTVRHRREGQVRVWRAELVATDAPLHPVELDPMQRKANLCGEETPRVFRVEAPRRLDVQAGAPFVPVFHAQDAGL